MAFVNLFLVLILCVVYIHSIMACPTNCNCYNDSGKYNVNCTDWMSEYILDLPSTTQILTINSGILKVLNKDSFTNVTNIESISIENTKLEDVGEYTFNGLKLLHSVNLKSNMITALPDFTFNNLISLTSIDLRLNKISSITSHCCEILPELDELLLQNNEINDIKEGTFADLPKLTKLFLSVNKLTYINKMMFKGLNQLQLLYLGFNLIKYIEPDSFKDLNKLSILKLFSNELSDLSNNTFIGLGALLDLNIKHNPISFININTFAHLPSLKYLDLQYCYISKIELLSFNTLLNLEQLNLQGNPLNFSCNTFASLSSMLDHGVTIYNATFKTPLSLEGLDMNDVNYTKTTIECYFYLCYKYSIDCLNDDRINECPLKRTINCACAEHTNRSRSCSVVLDCRTYGCATNETCIVDQYQWKCSKPLSPYVCNQTECKNNGKCVPHNETFTCTCKTGFKGELCENIYTDEDSNTSVIVIAVVVSAIIVIAILIVVLCWYFKCRKDKVTNNHNMLSLDDAPPSLPEKTNENNMNADNHGYDLEGDNAERDNENDEDDEDEDQDSVVPDGHYQHPIHISTEEATRNKSELLC